MGETSQQRRARRGRRARDLFARPLRVNWQRLVTEYECQRRRTKTVTEILLEGAAKLANKPMPSVMGKLFSSRARAMTAAALSGEMVGATVEQIVRRPRFSSAAFFVDAGDQRVWNAYRHHYPDRVRTVIEDADRIVRHELDLLGSGLVHWGEPIDWHRDPKSGYRWPKTFYTELLPTAGSPVGADVKLPYELSRMQHLPTLGKAYRLSGDERYAGELIAQVVHWLDANPYLIGVNWTCAMDAAIRIVNIIWALALIEGAPAWRTDVKERVLVSLWQHGQFIVRHLEYSIRPDGRLGNHNHYLSDIVGLAYLGILFPELKAAALWREIAVTGLCEEMERQVYRDGASYESSTFYHAFAVELFTSAALLCRLNGIALPEAFWTHLERMYAFVLNVTRPDGTLPQVGDADDGRLHVLADYGRWERTDRRPLLAVGAVLFERADMKAAAGAFSEDAFWLLGEAGAHGFDTLGAGAPPLPSAAFADAGFYVMRSAGSYVLVCCNPVGSAGAGHHKHNDLLSFEFYTAGCAFIVDPGTYVYTAAPDWRRHFRSTSAHNTVVIDRQEQNRFEKYTVFPLIADALPLVHAWSSTPDADVLDAEHAGYQRLTGAVVHRRMFRLDKRTHVLEICDTLRGSGPHTAEWYFHFDRGVDVERVSDTEFRARAAGALLNMTVSCPTPLSTEIQEGWISRRYGHKEPARVLRLSTTFTDSQRLLWRGVGTRTLDASS